MLKKFVKHNEIFLIVLIILITFSGLIIYFSGKQIYHIEEKRQNGLEYAELNSTKKSIKMFFSKTMHELFFLRDLPSIEKYVNNNFKSNLNQNKINEIFYDLAMRNYNQYCDKEYYGITVIDSLGQERIKIINNDNGKKAKITSKNNLRNIKEKSYFKKTIKLDKEQIYISPIKLNLTPENKLTKVPTVKLAVPLLDSKDNKKGILVLKMYLFRVLKLLPKDVSIYTEKGKVISLNQKVNIKITEAAYDMENINNHDSKTGEHKKEAVNGHKEEKSHEGQLYKEHNKQGIHYVTFKPLSGEKWIIGTKHSHPSLVKALQKIKLVSSIIYIIVIGLILFISYKTLQKFKDLLGAQKAIILSLVKLTEGRDPQTGAHLERTRNYAVALAKQLQKEKKYSETIDDEFIESIFEASLLHDIGKVGIRDSVLLKEEELTDKEYEEIKEHVKIGEEVLEDIIEKFDSKQPFLFMAKNICAYHHEKYNGEGYLEGLKGEEIPLEARIFTLCDAYDAIRSKRCYKCEISHQEAIKRIKADKGRHFDPEIVNAFLKCEEEFLKISQERK